MMGISYHIYQLLTSQCNGMIEHCFFLNSMMKSSSTSLPSLRLGRPHPGAELKCMNEIEKKAKLVLGGPEEVKG